MSPVTPLVTMLLSSCISLLVIAIMYFIGKKSNRNLVNSLRPQLFITLKDSISEFSEEQSGSATWLFKGTIRSGFPMQIFNVIISLTRRHLVFPFITAKIWGSNEFLIIEGDFKRKARMALEILHRREQQVISKYRNYFRTLDWVNVTNPNLAEKFLLKTNNPAQAEATLRSKDLEQALLAAEPYLYWASIETESPHLRVAFRLNPSFTVANAAKMATLLIRKYDQVLRKAEVRRP